MNRSFIDLECLRSWEICYNEYTEFVKREYRKGGKGFQIDGNEYSVWFDETGMQIAVGHTVTDHILDKVYHGKMSADVSISF